MNTLDARAYDAWITREPDWNEPPLPGDPGWPRCSACGCWLRLTPDSTEDKATMEHCSGRRPCHTGYYTEGDCDILDVIGWDFLGKKYHITYDFECQGRTGGTIEKDHTAHEYVAWVWTEAHRLCRKCGHDNVEVLA